ncbi:MAG: hypothetical protein V1807_01430 [Patescibacteria group bacterium]
MRKQKLLFWATSALSLISVFLVVQPAGAAVPEWVKTFFGGLGGIVGGALSLIALMVLQIIGLLIALLRLLVGPLLQNLTEIGIKQSDFLVNSDTASQLWSIAITVANGLFLLGLLIAAIAIMIRISTSYNLKKTLGAFITAVILSNLSLIIVKASLTLGNRLEDAVYIIGGQLGAISGAEAINSRSILVDYLNGLIDMNLNIEMFKGGVHIDLNNLGSQLGHTLMQFAIFGLIIWIIVKLILILIERIIRLFVLAVTAPIVFATSILPTFQGSTKQWWESLIKWILVLPLTVATILVAMFFFQQAGIKSVDNIKDISDKLPVETSYSPTNPGDQLAIGATIAYPDQIHVAAEDTTPDDGSTIPIDLKNLLLVAVGFWALWMAGMVGRSLNIGSVLGGIVETPQKAWKGLSDTATGKNLLGKTGHSIAKAGYRGFTNTPRGQQFEGWRQSRKGITGFIFNRANEAARTKADRERFTQEQIQNQVGKRYTNANNVLNTATTAAAVTIPAFAGKTWNDLNDSEKEQVRNANRSNKKFTAAEKTYNNDPRWITWAANKQAKDMDVNQMEGTDEIIRKIEKHDSAGEAGQANLLLAQLKKKLTSAGVSAAEKDEIRDWISDKGGYELSKRTGYTLPTKQQAKQPEPTDSDSYVDLLRLRRQQTHNQTDLTNQATAGGNNLDPLDQAKLTTGTHGKDVIDPKILSDLNRDLSTVATADLRNLTTNTADMTNLKNAVARGDTKGADTILTRHNITDPSAKKAIIDRAKTMTTADLELQLKLVASAKQATPPGGNVGQNLNQLVDTIKKLQATRETIKQIENNQVNVRNSSQASYDNTINNEITKPGGATIYNSAGTAQTTNNRIAVDAAMDIWKGQLETFMTNNPTLKKDSTLANIQSAAQGAGIDVTQLVNTLKNLGVGTDIQGGNISIDEVLKRLDIIHH